MIEASVWLLKLLLSHLLTDFVWQPKSWVEDRNQAHFRSAKLYLHGLVAGISAVLFTGPSYWLTAITIWITHTAIDGWKSYRKPTVAYFLADQALHVLVILACWCFSFFRWPQLEAGWQLINADLWFWKIATGALFLTAPAGILIGQFTAQWRDKIKDAESLANAGKWIGIAERIIVFILVINSQYSAIGLLVTAKGIIRFSEKDRQETKTEYLVIGTLLSIGIAMLTGLMTKL